MGFTSCDDQEMLNAIETMFDGVVHVDRDGCIICFSEKVQSVCFDACQKGIIDKSSTDSVQTEPEKLLTAIRRAIDEDKLIIIEELYLSKDMYFECRISPYKGGALLLLSDVTAKRIAQQKLAESERSKEVILSNLPGMAYRCNYDRNWTMQYVSEGCFKLTGYHPENLIGNRDLSYNDLVFSGYRESLCESWTEAVRTKSTFRGEYPITKVTGERVWVFEQGVAVYNKAGEIEALEGLIIDVSASKDKENEINFLLTHDTLTGTYNRRFYLTSKSEWDKDESLLPISLIIGDIDGLKLINDAFGAAKGDEFLVETARTLNRCSRSNDILARLGGDDFVLLLPNTDEWQAEIILRQIQSAFFEHNTLVDNDCDKIYISFGVATKDMPDVAMDSVQKLAEENMNKRKLLQRNSLHSSIVESIKQTMGARSQETEEHAERLAELTHEVGLRMHLTQVELNELELLATLHDIGKIGVNDQILNKPGKLTPEEWTQMRKHTEIGYRIAMASPELISIADFILTHHERWDGGGYPQGLSGEAIPLISRILSVVDAYDAMTQDRAYRKAMSKEAAVTEIRNNSSKQFDPRVVEIFLKVIDAA
jgi:diguanylate cyclase (GGDEF)-like protein/PAS domain S-box-containing protein